MALGIRTICAHECQVCGEVTALNEFSDGSVTCSCPAHQEFELGYSGRAARWVPSFNNLAEHPN